jgi:Protein of unknown function (DUF3667)
VTTVDTGTLESRCLNCGEPLHGRYCAECGQPAGHVHPTVHELLHELAHEFLHVDGKILQSVRLLFTRPGLLTKECVEGRRARHVSPLRLYLTFSVLFFAVTAYVGIPPTLIEDANRGTVIQIGGIKISSKTEFARLSHEEITELVTHAEHEWPPRLMFLLVPVCGVLVMLVTRRSGRHYPEHLWFALHGHAAYFGVAALIAPLALLHDARVTSAVSIAGFAFVIGYVIVAFRTAYGGGWGRAVMRTISVLSIYTILISAALIAVFLAVLVARARSG